MVFVKRNFNCLQSKDKRILDWARKEYESLCSVQKYGKFFLSIIPNSRAKGSCHPDQNSG
ncbi:hypothetical protein PITCH_A930004 [uncultured Desulfobacterium sp.]|uniref:Uncharacterized protein n=1 Tax=uncultured Desulfobacterium sp. TaxID=201089 RepID=A0A445N423_9BACT|nr:hypothetical protein PITCH_A930004 [uncultured Desulfobacterium sp.]